MVKGKTFATSLSDSCSCSFSESESSHGQFGNGSKSLIISNSANNYYCSVATQRYQPQEAYLFLPKCLTMREIERGGLLTLDDTNLLRMVLAKAESVLLTRNLKSYTNDELK